MLDQGVILSDPRLLDEILFRYDPPAETDATQHEDIQTDYPRRWPLRLNTRDKLCSMCVAVMARQEIMEIGKREANERVFAKREALLIEQITKNAVSIFSTHHVVNLDSFYASSLPFFRSFGRVWY